MSIYFTGPEDIRGLVNHLRAIDKEAIQDVNKKVRPIGRAVVSDAKSRASYSRRIPGAIRMRTNIANRGNPGITIRVLAAQAPHGRLLEGIARGHTSHISHPVFGNRKKWVRQPTRPYLRPAMQQRRSDFLNAAREGVHDAARRHGFI